MTIFGRFIWGTISAWAWEKHMQTEAIPYAKKRGESRQNVRAALLARMGKRFDEVWPHD